jgi:catechol 2,3-dioxygenase-like lactoylglutathione lyase family enzyme
VCYCCTKDELPSVVDLMTAHFGFRHTMSTPEEATDGSVLGLSGKMTNATAFVYDHRGPRTSPAIEVQAWIDPPLEGSPSNDPTDTGIQALGIAVADLDAAITHLESAGCTIVGRARSPFDETWATVRDTTGVMVDLIERPGAEPARLAHIRVGSRDHERSLRWYGGLGFEEVGRAEVTDGTFLGIEGGADASVVRLRLEEEPFEVVLLEWRAPEPTRLRHPEQANSAGLFRAALRVEDTRAAHGDLVSAGYEFDRDPMLVELHGTPVPDMWICFLSDPDGVPYELVQRPRSAFRP